MNVNVEVKESGLEMLESAVSAKIAETAEGFSASIVEVALMVSGFNMEQRKATMARICKKLNVHIAEGFDNEGLPIRRFKAGTIAEAVEVAETRLAAEKDSAEFSVCPKCGEEVFGGESCICEEVEEGLSVTATDEVAEVVAQ